ncbi:uncharacterized protein LOC134262591, partial [Saccostrea cucullata]|uniref:uncharacterized protein LOC134262591 n=1 Tax=Saccostrea cuccullata TaxID=36930 RepID=UPI002ED05ABA
MDRIPTLSLAVYEGLCHNMGTPMEVRMRREVDDTIEFVEKPVDIFKGINKMKSGSKREGFRLENSDLDVMIWSPGHKVICDLSQINLHSIQNHSLILMDNEDLPPGFTRLNLLSETHNNIQAVIIYYSCILINEKLYISSALFRSNQLQILRYTDIYSSAFLHGPCSTWSTGHLDMDFAFCFRSHHWPPIALPWIHRCRQQGWPSEVVISDILRSGFHVVPIGSTPENGEEWRISFSAAEQKLVYSLNH